MSAHALSEATSAYSSRLVCTTNTRHLDPDVHHEYEFGGPVGTAAMMLGFPLLLYYLYVCLVAFDGWPQYPRSLSDVQPFFSNFYQLSKKVPSAAADL